MNDTNDTIDRTNYQTKTILAQDHYLSNDTWQTGLNDNMLVVGTSGSGKTRNVLTPNLLEMSSSYLVLDTKGALYDQVAPALRAHGYEVDQLDFTRTNGTVGYNPFDFIRYDEESDSYSQQDMISIADTISPTECFTDPFWDKAAANYLTALIAYTMEKLPEDEHDLASVVSLFKGMADGSTDNLMHELEETDPDSYALRIYHGAEATAGADKMHASILGIIAEKLRCFSYDAAFAMYRNPHKVDFTKLATHKAALFVTVSDVDHSLAPLTSIFLKQAFQTLIDYADHECADRRLPVPVRFMLDDFCNYRIEDFDDYLSIIRSREIWATVIIQTITQLNAKYGEDKALSILGNCDVQMALSFQDMATARYFADMANKPASRMYRTPLDQAWLFVRGQEAEVVHRYDVTMHPNYLGPRESASVPAPQPAKEPSHQDAAGL